MIPVDDVGVSAKPLLAIVQIVQGALADGVQTGTVERVGTEDLTASGAQFGTECRGTRGAVEKFALGQRVVVECEHVAVVVKSARGDRDGGGLVGHTTRMNQQHWEEHSPAAVRPQRRRSGRGGECGLSRVNSAAVA